MRPRTLVVGLGGTGGQALIALKNLFRTYAENLPQGNGPTPSSVLPSHVRLLYVDTVGSEGRSGVSLDEPECVRLAVRDPQELLKSSSNGHLLHWFPRLKVASQTLIHGAAQIRPLGRLALPALVEHFLERLVILPLERCVKPFEHRLLETAWLPAMDHWDHLLDLPKQ